MNYYDILGVPRSATHDEIKAAYRKCEIIHFQLLLNTTDLGRTLMLLHTHNIIDCLMSAVCMQTHPDVAGTQRTSDGVEKFKRVSEAYSILGNQKERRRYDFETGETGIRDLRNRRAAAAASARGTGGGMGSGSFAATLPRNLLIGGMLGFAGVTALRTMRPSKEEGDDEGGAWTSRTGQKRLVEAWKNPNTGRWETPRPWDPTYQKLQPPLQLVPRDEVDDIKGRR